MDGAKPGLCDGRPVRDREFGGADAEAVPTFGVDVELGGDPGILEGLIVDECSFDAGGVVVLCDEDDGGWGLGVGGEEG